jgi:hypothetical protein
MAVRTLRRAGVLAAALLAAAGSGAASCDEPRAAAPPPGTQAGNPGPTPGPMRGAQITGKTGVRLLLPGLLFDVDSERSTRVRVTDWLSGPDGTRILLDLATSGEFGPIRMLGAAGGAVLPGGPTVWRIAGPPTARLALSRDGRGLWVKEQSNATECTLREATLAGTERRPTKPIGCDLTPVWETDDGLWVRSVQSPWPLTLLDPATLGPRGEPAMMELIDSERAFVLDEVGRITGVRGSGSGSVTPLAHPSELTDFTVHDVNPNGRYVAVEFVTPSSSPQTIDVWVLDLSTLRWLRVPTMPAYANLKFSGVAWAPDAQLVLVGQFPDASDEEREVIALWRPGAATLELRPIALPLQAYDSGMHDPLAL